ncbi:hypothetical protein V6Z11_D07G119900 [Gossypium hirsutum]
MDANASLCSSISNGIWLLLLLLLFYYCLNDNKPSNVAD